MLRATVHLFTVFSIEARMSAVQKSQEFAARARDLLKKAQVRTYLTSNYLASTYLASTYLASTYLASTYSTSTYLNNKYLLRKYLLRKYLLI
jgi:hypothetical protein